MSKAVLRLSLALIVAAFSVSPTPGWTQQPRFAWERLGVDLVRLVDGRRMYGFVLDVSAGQIQLAIERQWYLRTYPDQAKIAVDAESDRQRISHAALLERIRVWEQQVVDMPGLAGFLQDELVRLGDLPQAAVPERLFVVLNLERSEVASLDIQPLARRRIAALAWQHGLEQVTITPVTALERQLIAAGIDVATQAFDLAEQVEPRPADARQWAARRALVEYQLGRAVEFQGSGENLYRVGSEGAGEALLNQLFAQGQLGSVSQLGRELGLPEFAATKDTGDRPDGPKRKVWWREAAREAESDGYRGALMTRLLPSSLETSVQVERLFVARMDSGDWFVVARFVASADPAEQSRESLDRLRQDSQVKKVLDLMNTVGIEATGVVEQALRHGAATQSALLQSKSDFQEYLSNASKRLDGPPLVLAGN